jgi:transposase
VKRLRRHQAELFTFLSRPEAPSDNNHAGREIRPAVMMRKNSYANASDDGALTQAMRMSVLGALKRRGHNPVSAVLNAVRACLQTGRLPPLPAETAELG